MHIEYLGGPQTPGDQSPAVYKTSRGTYLVQGYKVPGVYRDQARSLIDTEDLVEVPAHLVQVIRDLAD